MSYLLASLFRTSASCLCCVGAKRENDTRLLANVKMSTICGSSTALYARAKKRGSPVADGCSKSSW
ncbi:hypothetical protein M378DRAFT_169532 [Amanita muscaria Koide BX008]|uniref:Secreted protein n=1 Tax=Amanita muscaria (strain Koide BX008) TaxID=946122 RepID=A0A0C2WR88_AMAMK|nr:hypothetical protein M378DRAFT_169532 [Amanita muscaria Koide BX008]